MLSILAVWQYHTCVISDKGFEGQKGSCRLQEMIAFSIEQLSPMLASPHFIWCEASDSMITGYERHIAASIACLSSVAHKFRSFTISSLVRII